ncbi:MAG: SMI1/KNR4 family protein [Xanthomonadales bacterium]|nr:SMI1/KNR4 family protein [Xanthomonadales bacterium]
MNLKESFELINSFSKIDFGLGKRSNSISNDLETQKGISFPIEFKEYIDNYAPINNQYFSGVGNSISLYNSERLSWVMDGYNFNPIERKSIAGWDDSWFLFADEGADPIIVDLSEQLEYSVVYQAMHGTGDWQFGAIADSIGQFLVCIAAFNHALTGFNVEDAIVDNENGFNLHEKCASWLFPFISKYANNYYEDWLSVFENS